MTAGVLFGDTAALVIGHLAANLDPDVVVVSKVPTTRPAQLVLVRRLGGPRLNLVADNALIGVECWAALEEDAHDLAQLCRAYINAMSGTTVDGTAVYRVAEAAGPQLLPDPTSDVPRFVFTVQIATRGTAFASAS